MNKQAIIDGIRDLTPTELMLLGGTTGAGGFATLRLLSELSRRTGGDESMLPKQKTIPLMLKNPLLPQAQNQDPEQQSNPAIDSSVPAPIGKISSTLPQQDWVPQALALGGGVPLGFLGAKFLYDKYQENENSKNIENAKQQYLQQLTQAQAQAQAKTAENTPLVDKFCEGLCDALQKSGSSELNLPDIASNPVTQEYIRNSYNGGYDHQAISALKNLGDSASGNVFHDVGGALSLLGLGAGVGTLGYLISKNKAKREKEQGAQYPVGVSYANE